MGISGDVAFASGFAVGCGAAGLAASYLLGKGADTSLTLFESGEHFGGHANTVEVQGVPIDTGFLVYNENTYPNLIGLFEVRTVQWRAHTRLLIFCGSLRN